MGPLPFFIALFFTLTAAGKQEPSTLTLLKKVDSLDPVEQAIALETIRGLDPAGRTQLAEPLLQQLQASSWLRSQQAYANAIGALGKEAQPLIPRLKEMFANGDNAPKATKALIAMGDHAHETAGFLVDRIERRASSGDYAARILSTWKRIPEPELKRLLRRADEQVHFDSNVFFALSGATDQSALIMPTLMDALRSPATTYESFVLEEPLMRHTRSTPENFQYFAALAKTGTGQRQLLAIKVLGHMPSEASQAIARLQQTIAAERHKQSKSRDPALPTPLSTPIISAIQALGNYYGHSPEFDAYYDKLLADPETRVSALGGLDAAVASGRFSSDRLMALIQGDPESSELEAKLLVRSPDRMRHRQAALEVITKETKLWKESAATKAALADLLVDTKGIDPKQRRAELLTWARDDPWSLVGSDSGSQILGALAESNPSSYQDVLERMDLSSGSKDSQYRYYVAESLWVRNRSPDITLNALLETLVDRRNEKDISDRALAAQLLVGGLGKDMVLRRVLHLVSNGSETTVRKLLIDGIAETYENYPIPETAHMKLLAIALTEPERARAVELIGVLQPDRATPEIRALVMTTLAGNNEAAGAVALEYISDMSPRDKALMHAVRTYLRRHPNPVGINPVALLSLTEDDPESWLTFYPRAIESVRASGTVYDSERLRVLTEAAFDRFPPPARARLASLVKKSMIQPTQDGNPVTDAYLCGQICKLFVRIRDGESDSEKTKSFHDAAAGARALAEFALFQASPVCEKQQETRKYVLEALLSSTSANQTAECQVSPPSNSVQTEWVEQMERTLMQSNVSTQIGQNYRKVYNLMLVQAVLQQPHLTFPQRAQIERVHRRLRAAVETDLRALPAWTPKGGGGSLYNVYMSSATALALEGEPDSPGRSKLMTELTFLLTELQSNQYGLTTIDVPYALGPIDERMPSSSHKAQGRAVGFYGALSRDSPELRKDLIAALTSFGVGDLGALLALHVGGDGSLGRLTEDSRTPHTGKSGHAPYYFWTNLPYATALNKRLLSDPKLSDDDRKQLDANHASLRELARAQINERGAALVDQFTGVPMYNDAFAILSLLPLVESCSGQKVDSLGILTTGP